MNTINNICFIDPVFLYSQNVFVLDFSSLHQFINVVICVDHCRAIIVNKFSAFVVYVMAIAAILSVFGRSHITEET